MTYLNDEHKIIDVKSIDEHAVDIFQKLRNFEKRREAIAKNHKILICGDYGDNLSILEKIREKLKNDGYPAFLAQDLKKDVKMPSYEHTCMLMNECDILILIEGVSIGTGIDCGLIISDGNFQTKTVFLTNKTFDDMINLSSSRIYYPMYDFWNNHDELMYKAVNLAKKEAHRLAKIYIDKHKSTINIKGISN